MPYTMFLEYLAYERLLNKKFVKALQDQGHSYADVFEILLDMEFQRRPNWNRRVSQAIREGTVNGYLCFERGECGHWHVLLTELGQNNVLGDGEL